MMPLCPCAKRAVVVLPVGGGGEACTEQTGGRVGWMNAWRVLDRSLSTAPPLLCRNIFPLRGRM